MDIDSWANLGPKYSDIGSAEVGVRAVGNKSQGSTNSAYSVDIFSMLQQEKHC